MLPPTGSSRETGYQKSIKNTIWLEKKEHQNNQLDNLEKNYDQKLKINPNIFSQWSSQM